MSPQTEEFNLFYDQEIIEKEVVNIEMKKGDVGKKKNNLFYFFYCLFFYFFIYFGFFLVIWSSRLPHANGISKGNNWRLQCFVRYVSSTLRPGYSQVGK